MATVLRQEARARRPGLRRAVALGLIALAGLTALAVLRDRGTTELPAPPGLADLWAGHASLVLDRKWTSTDLGQPAGGAYAGAHIEVVGSTWYLFNRQTGTEECPGRGPKLGLQVRRSTDRGATWSAPVTILAPTPGTPWACGATDGDAVFDREAGVWRYLFQCRDETGGWSGCYAERRDTSPLGPFEAPAGLQNPVIRPGALWSRICDFPGDRCGLPPGAPPIADEGSFSLIAAPGGGWWVGFHGSDGTHGVRGIARTSTFRPDDWEADGEGGTPVDAVLGAGDTAGWREEWHAGGSIGAGAATMLAQDGWYYQVAEFADESLACTPGQTWDLGLFRARELASTDWEQLPAGNPLVYSGRLPGPRGVSEPCNVQYPGLFRDPETGVTYLMHGRLSSDPTTDAIYLYRLEWDRNLLANGDFRHADTEGWSAPPGAAVQFAAERAPERSADGTPDLSFACGAACDGQGISQEVVAPPGLRGETLAFGGWFRAEAAAGTAELTLTQLDASGAPIASQVLPIAAGAAYAAVRATAPIDERTARLRLTLTPRAPGTLRADHLFLIPQDGCDAPRYPAC